MVYELTLNSVQIKTTIFNPPAKLINYKELSCAIGMAYKEAGLPCPEGTEGQDIHTFWEESLAELKDSSQVKDAVRQAIETYIFKPGEVMDEDSRICLGLGYEAG